MKVDRCRSCNAEIIWAITPEGRIMPVDAKPRRGFHLTQPIGEQVQTGPLLVYHESHYATCPDAEKWRGRNRGQERLPGMA